MISFYTAEIPIVSDLQDLGKAQGGTFFLIRFYGTFNSLILNQIEAGSRPMQQVDAVLQCHGQVIRDQMPQRYKDVIFCSRDRYG